MKIVESEYWKKALRSCHVEEGHPTEVIPANHPTEVTLANHPAEVAPANHPTEVVPVNHPTDATPVDHPTDATPVEVICIQIGPHANPSSCPPTQNIHSNNEVHPQSHLTETTPLRKLIIEMPGRHILDMNRLEFTSNWTARVDQNRR